jgi:peptidoglycan/xylan/chitin deacetylase (PgdA/CDA1 family)
VTHPVLSSLSASRQKVEILRSKEAVEEIVGRPIRNLAYPYGDFNSERVAMLRECQFKSACSTAGNAVQKGAALFQLPRIHVGNWSGEEFERRVEQWFRP